MMKEDLDTWKCKTCFTSNKYTEAFCQKCGKDRYKIEKVRRSRREDGRPLFEEGFRLPGED